MLILAHSHRFAYTHSKIHDDLGMACSIRKQNPLISNEINTPSDAARIIIPTSRVFENFNPMHALTPRVKPTVIQSFLTFDSMDRTLECDHSLESC